MTQHSTDTFATAYNETSGILTLRRHLEGKPLEDDVKPFNLGPDEILSIMKTILGIPAYQQKAVEQLEALNLARPNHS